MSDHSTAHTIQDAVHLISKSLNEVVPPEAQVHFLNAQRELLLGLVLCIEHNSERSLRDPRRTPARTKRKTAATSTRRRRSSGGEPPSNRPQRVTLD
jgi:hypothetical protein